MKILVVSWIILTNHGIWIKKIIKKGFPSMLNIIKITIIGMILILSGCSSKCMIPIQNPELSEIFKDAKIYDEHKEIYLLPDKRLLYIHLSTGKKEIGKWSIKSADYLNLCEKVVTSNMFCMTFGENAECSRIYQTNQADKYEFAIISCNLINQSIECRSNQSSLTERRIVVKEQR